METIPTPYPELFKPITIGKIVKSGCFSSTVVAQGLTLNTRIVMSAMGRMRSNQEGLANDLIAEYYAQRASAGFVVTESSPVSKRSNQHPNSPSIYNDEQAEAWKKVTSAVHAKKGIIFLQLQHNGRQTHSSLQNGLEPWAPSPIRVRGTNRMAGNKEYETPHEMTLEEIRFTLNEFKEATERAKRAGFDGVEVNGGHGFLVDQFLRDSSNKRTDQYGGSPQNRCKFAIELLQILTSIFPGRVAIKLTPTCHSGDMFDSKVLETYQFLFRQLSQLQLAYVVLKKDADDENSEGFGYPASLKQIPCVYTAFRQFYSGVLVGNGGITPESADEDIRTGKYDIAMIAKAYINNPDLVERARHGYPLNHNIDWSTAFGGAAKGYTDYPRYEPKAQPYLELLKPIKVGDLELANRITMSAMGRVRCTDPDLTPNDIMATYYAQRASAGLIVAESTNINWTGYTYPGSCGIFTESHVKGWAKVTKAVHDKGGKIFLQLYHGGRLASKKFKDIQPVAPSAIAIRGTNRYTQAPYEIPKELTAQEITQTINEFIASAQKSKDAGFDGVELAAGHGSLIDQFLRNSANKRTDQYGGSVENRSRFLLDIVRGIAKIFPNRIGVKVTPAGPTGDLLDSDPVKLYSYLFQELSKLPLAYVVLKHDDEAEGAEGFGFPAAKKQIPDVFAALRPHYKGVLIANHVSQDEAVKGIQSKQYDAVSFARLFINNPDLVHRLRNNLELNLEYDYSTFFGGGEKGYTDFKPYHEWKK